MPFMRIDSKFMSTFYCIRYGFNRMTLLNFYQNKNIFFLSVLLLTDWSNNVGPDNKQDCGDFNSRLCDCASLKLTEVRWLVGSVPWMQRFADIKVLVEPVSFSLKCYSSAFT